MLNEKTQKTLADLIAFDTTSRNPNKALIAYIQNRLEKVGAKITILPNAEDTKANLYATIGRADFPGVLLSGHTDVVPVDGQDWTKPPFCLTEQSGKLFGRGTADMKGFVASALCAAESAAEADRQSPLKTPLHLAFSYDEEIGCIGVGSLIDMLANAPFVPALCIVGEPTSMKVATGHKGKLAARAICHGQEAHSALAPTGLNAIHLAADFVTTLKNMQIDLATEGAQDSDFAIPYSTVHVGKIAGGVALNIVPNTCTIDFEIRNIAEDDAETLFNRIQDQALAIARSYKAQSERASIKLVTSFTYPGLNTPKTSKAVAFVTKLTGGNKTCKVAFGTEGGLFASKLGIPTVVCGPGDMAQGHKPDEFISIDQLARYDAALARLVDFLRSDTNLLD